jgi:transposase
VAFQKRTLVAAERDAARRAAWRREIQALAAVRFVCVDESSPTITLTRRSGWDPLAERLVAAVPRKHGSPTSVVAALTPDGWGPVLTREGAIDTLAFVADVRELLGPTLEPGPIVIRANLRVHQAEAVCALIAARHSALFFLPPSSPAFSPIEHAFHKLKAIRLALERISPDDAHAFFGHCGYNLAAVA